MTASDDQGSAPREATRNEPRFPALYRVTGASWARAVYEGHRLVTVEVESRRERGAAPAGALLVRTSQELGTLASYLLEPQSEDGLCAWNFFDSAAKKGEDFPVLRVPSLPK